MYLRILDAAQKNDAFVARLRPQWQKLWNQTTGAITQLKTKSYDAQDHQEVAEDCFGLLQDLDSRPSLKLQGGNNAPGNEQYEDASSEEDYECWLERFKPEDSLFPDDLFQALASFVPEGIAWKFYRVRRIQHMYWATNLASVSAKDVSDGLPVVCVRRGSYPQRSLQLREL